MSNTTDRYSLTGNNWSVMKPSINKRYAGTAGAVPNIRKILVFGGRTSHQDQICSSIEEYDVDRDE